MSARDGRVLVVEDDEAFRTALVAYLHDRGGIETDGARDGVDALHHLLTRRYSVILLDMIMPKMTGGDVLDSLQAMVSDPSLELLDYSPSVIVVTATPEDERSDETIRRRFKRLVRAVFRKPVDCATLASVVEREMDLA
jgi:CheY-like chemotaxis protein